MSSIHIGYKKCRDNKLVILEILGENNEERDGVSDKYYAKMRCSKAKVLWIFDMDDDTIQYDEAYGIYNPKFRYEVGQIVEPDHFNPNLNTICGGGIHYFLSSDGAYMYNLNPHSAKYTGQYENRNNTGNLLGRINLIDGKRHGFQEIYYLNGQLKTREEYEHGKLVGSKEKWYDNGQIMEFIHSHGLCEKWYKNGQIKERSNYENGRQTGDVETWYEDGQPRERSIFTDNKKYMVCEKWYPNGQPRERIIFKARTGTSIYMYSNRRGSISWYKDGQIKEINKITEVALIIHHDKIEKEVHHSFESFYQDGTSKIGYRTINGKKHGYHERWHSNGQMEERTLYMRGECIGKTERWDEDGEPIELSIDDIYGCYYGCYNLRTYKKKKRSIFDSLYPSTIIKYNSINSIKYNSIKCNSYSWPNDAMTVEQRRKKELKKEKERKRLQMELGAQYDEDFVPHRKDKKKWVQKGKRSKNHTYMKKHR
jgi:antitoxin component YwqK of YwqJK toxin-antitoxin module